MIINTMADLKSVVLPSYLRTSIYLLGFNAPGDGGGGRFWLDGAGTEADDGGTIIAPNSGGGRWKRIYSGPVNVDWFGANKVGDSQSAFIAASAFPHVECSNRLYRMEGTVTVKAGQVWTFNGATICHTDNTKTMFSAINVDGWTLIGPLVLKGTLTSSGATAETGVYVSGCNRWRMSGIMANLFRGHGFHISAGTFAGFKGDQGIMSDCSSYECTTSLRIDADSAAEYNLISNFLASGSLKGLQIGAGNTTINGLSVVQCNVGIHLTGGPNNGHGIISGSNINHCSQTAILADGVTNGFTFDACHIYSDSASSGHIRMQGGSTDIAFTDCVIDAPVVNDTGTNRITNCKTYSLYSPSGANLPGLIASGNY